MMKASVEVLEAIRKSNAIEGVYDLESYCQAIYAFDYLMAHEQIGLGQILKAHKTLMLKQHLLPNQKGYLRTIHVRVGERDCPAPMLVRPMLDDWLKNEWLNADSITSHVAFERIHPFVDGNGRIGRMLMFWRQINREGGLHDVPSDTDRKSYYAWFRDG